MSWPFFGVVAILLGTGVVVEPQTLARRATTIAAVGALIGLLHIISRAGRPLVASWTLVIGLSVVSRLEAGQMPVRRSVTHLSALTQSVVAAAHVVQPARDITVETLQDSACNCNAELNRRIIENLVSNAMKRTTVELPR